ncbi:MAG: universal stress protein [Mycobacteriales bacterium]
MPERSRVADRRSRDQGPDTGGRSALTGGPRPALHWYHRQEVGTVEMTTGKATGIVVGIDGSETASEAVEWAAATAALHRSSLTLCHVAALPAPAGTAAAGMAERLLEAAVLRAHTVAPGVAVVRRLLDGDVGGHLLRESAHAGMLVLGARGHHHRDATAELGSVATALVARACVPVAIVHRRQPIAVAPVVVGLDGADAGVMEIALTEAALRSRPVLALHAYQLPSLRRYDSLIDFGSAASRTADRRRLARTMAPWRDRYPQVEIVIRMVAGTPASVLAAASQLAELVVVGRPDSSPPAPGRMLAGLLPRAGAPVLAVPVVPAAVRVPVPAGRAWTRTPQPVLP